MVPGAHSLLRLCTMCVLIKNNRPPTADWIPPPYCGHIQNIPTPYCRARYPLLQTYKHVYGQDRTGQLLAYTGSWRGVQPGRGTGVEPGGLWSREFIAFISNIFRKVNTWGLLRERACFVGPICSRVDPHFKALTCRGGISLTNTGIEF
jgi:hypothetical protein